MKLFSLLALPLSLFGQTTLLSEADALSIRYQTETALALPPSPLPQTDQCLEEAASWFSVDLTHLKDPEGKTLLEMLSSEELWQGLREIGFEGIYFENLKEKTSFAIDPQWGSNWTQVALQAERKKMALFGDCLGASCSWGSDFELALQNVGEYPSLFHLIEIDPKDWNLLPPLPLGQRAINIPWLTLQELVKRGYVPTQSSPYVKESAWNATGKMQCADGKVRRWIYLKQGKDDPLFAYLTPSFGVNRIAAGAALNGIYQLGQKILFLDAKMPLFAKETTSLWIRKLDAFSIERIEGGLKTLQHLSSDLAFDIWTRAPLLHALLAEDAEALRLIYRLFLEERIELKRLVHSLQPFDRFTVEWAEFMNHPRQKFPYWEETVTGELLRQRLLKQDLDRLGGNLPNIPLSTWAGYSTSALGVREVEKRKEEIQKAHLLLAFTYAMQPGGFSLSAADLLGALPNQAYSLDLLGPNRTTLYESLPSQMRNSRSFASQLKKILSIRREKGIAKGELLALPPVKNRGSLLLLQRIAEGVLCTAVNFSRQPVRETMEHLLLKNATPIELMSGLAEEKIFESPQFSFSLSPLSGKVFFFQKKYYD